MLHCSFSQTRFCAQSKIFSCGNVNGRSTIHISLVNGEGGSALFGVALLCSVCWRFGLWGVLQRTQRYPKPGQVQEFVDGDDSRKVLALYSSEIEYAIVETCFKQGNTILCETQKKARRNLETASSPGTPGPVQSEVGFTLVAPYDAYVNRPSVDLSTTHCARTHTHSHTHSHAFTHTLTHTHTHRHSHTHTHTLHTLTHTHTDSHTHSHRLTHTDTHTHNTHTPRPASHARIPHIHTGTPYTHTHTHSHTLTHTHTHSHTHFVQPYTHAHCTCTHAHPTCTHTHTHTHTQHHTCTYTLHTHSHTLTQTHTHTHTHTHTSSRFTRTHTPHAHTHTLHTHTYTRPTFTHTHTHTHTHNFTHSVWSRPHVSPALERRVSAVQPGTEKPNRDSIKTHCGRN